MAYSIDDLLSVANTYAQVRSLSLARVSTLAFNDGAKLTKLSNESVDISTRRLARAMHWFATNWPAGGDWPDSVPRPPVPGLVNTGAPQVGSFQ